MWMFFLACYSSFARRKDENGISFIFILRFYFSYMVRLMKHEKRKNEP